MATASSATPGGHARDLWIGSGRAYLPDDRLRISRGGRRRCVGREGPVLTVVAEDGARREDVSLLDDVVREGARRMLTAMLEAEVDAYLAELASEDDERGRRGSTTSASWQNRAV